MPNRIQRKREKGWRMPKNTVSVTRPGRWGNPYRVSGQKGHWFVLDELGKPIVTFDEKEQAVEYAIKLFRAVILHKHNSGKINVLELKGKNLACFCKEGDLCHGDVLIELANK